MKLSVEEIIKQVDELEASQSDWRTMCETWEKMWRLEYFDRSTKQAQAEGHEQVTLPLPYNVVNLLCRLIADDPKTDCPARDLGEKQTEIAEKKERWLTAAWQLLSASDGKRINLVQGAKWQTAVRGAHVFEVKYIGDKLPKALRNSRFPILVRNLDPLNVGVREGPLYTEAAYHKYDEDVFAIKQRYPKWESKKLNNTSGRRKSTEKACVIDYWWIGDEGEVWNAVIIDKRFVVEPWKTKYGMIPIIWGGADTSLASNKSYRNLSILHSIEDLWPIMNRLESLKMTAVRWYYDPAIIVQNENGEEIGDIKVGPGMTTYVPFGTKIDQLIAVPNHQVIQFVMESMEKSVQEGTFPGVMYGQSPGSLQAGYGVSILSNAAEGRITSARYNLERSMEKVNALMLNLVETFSGADGIRVWGKQQGKSGFYYETLKAGDIDGYYENRVVLKHNVPQNDVQDVTMMLRLRQDGVVSTEWVQDNLPYQIPPDERKRVWAEQLLEDPEIKRNVMLDALKKTYPERWQEIVAGTQLAPPEEPQLPMLPTAQPPMPPEMMGGMPMQPPSMNMDAGTFPPNQIGQFTPELMGLDPNIDPMVWATLMNQPLPPEQQLPMMGGI